MDLWVLVDHVYLKPKTRFDLILEVAPLDGKSSFISQANERASMQVLRDCISEKVNKEVGYEANLAHLEYAVTTYENTGIRLSIDGYSDKLLAFVATFIDIMLSCTSEDGIDEALVTNSLEKTHRKFKNVNLEVDIRCNNNRK